MALRKGRSRLSEILTDRGMNQVDFARRMGVTESTVSKWKSGTSKMSFDHAVLAARILNCTAEDLYEWIES
ncbi:helix-turn-helix domain-containing protein [Terribacillus saccharophilus]|uniref:helix-turn-helix domain-containing protein n=1 Tax=Terribacillus saccharophilus TaxID=361277 RepID=UPI003981FFB1